MSLENSCLKIETYKKKCDSLSQKGHSLPSNKEIKVMQIMAVKFWPNLLVVLAFPQHPELQEFQSNPIVNQNINTS